MTDRTEYCAGLVRAGDPLRYLATLYAPIKVRPALFAIHALDLTLVAVATTTTDVMVGQIRLAWWRERLAEVGQGRVPAEPILSELAAADVLPETLEGFDDPSLALIDDSPFEWAVQRGERLFSAISLTLGVPFGPEIQAGGRGWAAVDGWRRGYLERDQAQGLVQDAPIRSSGLHRPLLALLAVARGDLKCADPGQLDGVTVSPSRQIRLAVANFTGRL